MTTEERLTAIEGSLERIERLLREVTGREWLTDSFVRMYPPAEKSGVTEQVVSAGGEAGWTECGTGFGG